MASPRRDFVTMTLSEMKELAGRVAVDVDLFEGILQEHKRRTEGRGRKPSPRQRALMESVAGGAPEAETPVHRAQGSTAKPADRSGAIGQPTQSTPRANEAADPDVRFEALRQTFTRDAERMARWGITPVLPDQSDFGWSPGGEGLPDGRPRQIRQMHPGAGGGLRGRAGSARVVGSTGGGWARCQAPGGGREMSDRDFHADQVWRRCEQAWAGWLEEQGFFVTRLCEAEGNAVGTRAPLVSHIGGRIRAPRPARDAGRAIHILGGQVPHPTRHRPVKRQSLALDGEVRPG